jgi:hypothetical protein
LATASCPCSAAHSGVQPLLSFALLLQWGEKVKGWKSVVEVKTRRRQFSLTSSVVSSVAVLNNVGFQLSGTPCSRPYGDSGHASETPLFHGVVILILYYI